MAFESLLSGKEVSEKQVDTAYLRVPKRPRASAARTHFRDRNDHSRARHKSACHFWCRFSGLVRQAIHCCYETLLASVDEESVFDDRAFWGDARQAGDGSSMVLCLP